MSFSKELSTFALLKKGEMYSNTKLIAGSVSKVIAERIAKTYGQPLTEVTLTRFSDGEFQVSIEETVRGKNVVIIQSTIPPADNLFELLLLVDAAKRASAKKIVVLIPYFGFARQDRKDKPRVAIGAKLVANLLMAAGINRIITMDLHADQIQGFFEVPVDHLFASTIFVPYIKELNLPNLMVATPDTGGSKRANAYAKHLDVDLAICYKQRKVANEVSSMRIIGDVKGKDVVIIDDMVDTAGTLTKAAKIMIDNGANSVRAVCTHGVLSGPAYDRIASSELEELVITDSIPLNKEKNTDKIHVLSTAPLFGEVLLSLEANKSISSHFIVT